MLYDEPYLRDRLVMTPGPTDIDERVRNAMSAPITNPDLDDRFAEFYKRLTGKLQRVMRAAHDVLVMSGEGILGLEAAVASIVQPGDDVLCVANGVFGAGFADFVRMYGGTPILLDKRFDEAVTAEELERALDAHRSIKAATLVHCETPSGLLNPVETLVPVLKDRGIISIVDAVSSIGGEPIDADAWGVDLLLGGSQKCFSAPPGLTIVAVSERAWAHMERRKRPIPGFYANLLTWRNSWLKAGEFPYTAPISDLYALDAAVDLIVEEGVEQVVRRHRTVAEALHGALDAVGLELFPERRAASHTVTAIRVPSGFDREAERRFRARLWEEEGVFIGGSLGELEGRVWRIGHMGTGADDYKVARCLRAMERLARRMARESGDEAASEADAALDGLAKAFWEQLP